MIQLAEPMIKISHNIPLLHAYFKTVLKDRQRNSDSEVGVPEATIRWVIDFNKPLKKMWFEDFSQTFPAMLMRLVATAVTCWGL